MSISPAPFRLIVCPRTEGRLAMAVDEALAEAVGAGLSPQVVRLYGFSPPTLSLGRFQKIKGRYFPERLSQDGITLVRRPTGGHAVLHDDELTYSVILSKALISEQLGDSRKRTVYDFIARTLLAGLENLGIRGRINSSRQGDLRNPDCFRSAGEFEITAEDGRKLIGSAQMTTRTAILQHGSIPMSNPGRRVFRYLGVEEPADSHEPSCLNEQAGRCLSFEEVRSSFAAAIRECLPVVESALLPEEEAAARRILAEKYASDSWNLAF